MTRLQNYSTVKRGESLPQSKLTAEAVREARDMHLKAQFARAYIDRHYSVAAIAAKYGVSAGAMDKALRYETWGHVE
jgi:transposase-like protein